MNRYTRTAIWRLPLPILYNFLQSTKIPQVEDGDTPDNSGSKINIEVSSHTGSSEAGFNGTRKRRGRKRGRGRLNGDIGSSENGSLYASPEEDGEEDQKRKQEKAEQRRELTRKHAEEIKWQAVHKILNEKGRKEREKEKKAKKEKEDQKAKEAAEDAKRKAALTNIHVKYYKDGSVTLSFPQGFLLPAVLSQPKANGVAVIAAATTVATTANGSRKIMTGKKCANCGNQGKYCDPKSGKISCSLACYKLVN